MSLAKSIFFILLFSVFGTSFAQDIWWQTEGKNKELRIVTEENISRSAFYFFATAADISNSGISIKFPKGSGLLINSSLFSVFEKDTMLTLSFADCEPFLREKDTLMFSVFSKKLNISEIHWGYGTINTQETAAISKPELGAVVRTYDHKNDNYIILFLVIMAFTALVKNTQLKSFSEILSFRKLFSLRMREEGSISSKPLNANNLFIYTLFGMVQALLVLTIKYHVDFQTSSYFSNLFASEIRTFLFFTVFFITLLGLKFILLYYMSILLGHKEMAYIHLLDYLRIHFIGFSLLLLILFLTRFIYPSEDIISLGFIKIYLVILLLFRVLYYYIRLNSRFTVRNSYLISYLCTTEILPVLIYLKVLISI
jgi:hypothetical protein